MLLENVEETPHGTANSLSCSEVHLTMVLHGILRLLAWITMSPALAWLNQSLRKCRQGAWGLSAQRKRSLPSNPTHEPFPSKCQYIAQH